MHLGHWQHGCLYGKHVFIKVIGEGEQARVEVALLDLESADDVSAVSGLQATTCASCAATRR